MNIGMPELMLTLLIWGLPIVLAVLLLRALRDLVRAQQQIIESLTRIEQSIQAR
jgi:cytochrome c-type biogenesis protein CcmH/NrfF